jgi:hypothetical protein
MAYPGHGEATTGGGLSLAAKRTAAFVAAGLGLLAVGSWLQMRPGLRSREVTAETVRGQPLFPGLSDAGQAASLEIISFDEDTAELDPFKVVKTGGVWVLPSQQNYPADAKDQLAAAATELIDRPIVDVISGTRADHERYGVVEPDANKLAAGAIGVGRLVEIRDSSGTKLARLIIGKEFKRPVGADASGRSLRYVRRAGQDPVYLAELDTTKFTSKFEDWIEKDLLKLSPWDVTQLTIDDSSWSVALTPDGRPGISRSRTSLIDLAYDDKEGKWSLVKLIGFGKGDKPEEQQLAPDQALAATKLNDLKQALADLTIVDVVRKPAGLSAELKADKKFADDQQAVLSLLGRGFFPLESGEMLSSSGETVVGMKDGVEYLLRFGNPTSVAGEAKDAGAVDGKDEPEAATDGAGRYLFVSARFNESLLTKPELKPLPEEPTKPEEGEDGGPDGESDALAKADEEEAKAQAALEERRRVERENRLAQEAYDEKVKAAQKRVSDLNGRFADWYYVVSEAEYAKIRLGRADVIEAKPADEAPAEPGTAPTP